jgi:dienelactone hydrolase
VSVRFVLRFERAKVPVRIVLDRQGRLSGLWFDRPEITAAYEPPDYVKKDAFREEKVTVSAGQFPLPGTLTIPVEQGPHPGVVLVHGSGPHDEDETVGAQRPFRDLAWGLASRGIAVLRYEKRTHAHPSARKADEWTLADETIDDALAAAELLRQRPEIAAKRVYVAGHSLGGLAAPYIAQRDGKLAGIIILAGAARSVLDMLEDQYVYLAKLDGTISPEEQQQIDKLKQITAAIRAGRLQDVPADAGLPARGLAELHKLNPPQAAAGLSVPILVIQGGRDYQATRADFTLWQKALGGRKDVSFRLFDDLNHLFCAGQGPSGPAEYQRPGHVDGRVIETIAQWISAAPERR